MQPLSTSSSSKSAFSSYSWFHQLTRSIARRFIPIIPALPNGLKDVISASQSLTTLPPDSRQRGMIPHRQFTKSWLTPSYLVDSLLNPCNCKSVWKCKCKISQGPSVSAPNVQSSVPFNGLATLARAAAMQCSSPESEHQLSSIVSDSDLHHSRPATPHNITSRKRQKQRANILTHTPGPDLPPIRFSPSSSLPSSIPDFPSMPSMNEISSLAGSGCTCGVRCACPGCVEHTDGENATDKRRDCGEGCGACIDHSMGVALPDLTSSQAKESTSFLDRFFARAAALPLPPAHRQMSTRNLDPVTYASASRSGSQPFNFGVINLPKLECCGGGCACPTGHCTCRVTCAGSCLDVTHDRESRQRDTLDDVMPSPRKPPGTCCSNPV